MFRHLPSAAVALGGTATLLLLVGCAGLEEVLDEAGLQGPSTVAYECDDDREFTARFSADREEVRVSTGGDRTYELELADRRGGQRVYSDDADDEDEEVRLTVEGEEAHLRIPGGSDFQDCEATA